MKTTLEYFNKTASEWSGEWLEEKREIGISKTFYELFSKANNFNPCILDAGCGAGYDSYILKELGASVVGVDFSENLIKIAEKNNPNCSFFVRNIEESLTSIGKFDGIFCNSVLNYIDITKLKMVLDNFAEVVKTGGLLFVSVLNGNGKNEQKSYSFIDGEEFDLNFSNINAEQLCAVSSPYFKLVDTFMFDDFSLGYKYYVFQRQ